MAKPRATRNNWKSIGLQIHAWFMQDMGISRGSDEEIIFLGLALAGEAGELANEAKKLWRDAKKTTPEQRLARMNKICMEMADVYGYLVHFADCVGVDLDRVTAAKTNELIERWPHIFEGPRQHPDCDHTLSGSSANGDKVCVNCGDVFNHMGEFIRATRS